MMNAKTILIVDDSLVILKALSLKLRAHGYQVLTASDTAKAIGIVRREKPDLIILDVNFPSDAWDGFGLMKWLRRMDEAQHAPVVIISGSDAGNYKERCREAGAVGFFLKPIDYEDLLATMRESLHQGLEEQTPVGLAAEPEPSPEPKAVNEGPRLILMVEDDAALGETLQLFLESQGLQVRRVTDGDTGLREVAQTDFDVILCDMVMPRMPGDRFYLGVEAVKPHLCKRFVFMTGHHADPRSDGFIRRARAVMLWKPFPLCDLLTAVQIVWKKNQAKASGPPPPTGRVPGMLSISMK